MLFFQAGRRGTPGHNFLCLYQGVWRGREDWPPEHIQRYAGASRSAGGYCCGVWEDRLGHHAALAQDCILLLLLQHVLRLNPLYRRRASRRGAEQ